MSNQKSISIRIAENLEAQSRLADELYALAQELSSTSDHTLDCVIHGADQDEHCFSKREIALALLEGRGDI